MINFASLFFCSNRQSDLIIIRTEGIFWRSYECLFNSTKTCDLTVEDYFMKVEGIYLF